MSREPIDSLLEQLNGGDDAAAGRAFRAYEPFLRQVVRRQLRPALRARFDSADVVQSVWADLVAGFRGARWHFADEAHLRAFLVRVTRNRFLDRARRAQTGQRREQSLAALGGEDQPAAPAPRPSESARGEEFWERLLALCPPAHHDILRLRRQGCTRAEIARRTGLHEGSVRRILRDLARRLAFEPPAPGGA